MRKKETDRKTRQLEESGPSWGNAVEERARAAPPSLVVLEGASSGHPFTLDRPTALVDSPLSNSTSVSSSPASSPSPPCLPFSPLLSPSPDISSPPVPALALAFLPFPACPPPAPSPSFPMSQVDIQERIAAARREAEGLKEKIRAKRDQTADTSRESQGGRERSGESNKEHGRGGLGPRFRLGRRASGKDGVLLLF